MKVPASPLRYPGRKARLSKLLKKIMYENQLQDCILVEPFAGGAGASLELLVGEHVSKIIINDLDPCIFAFWKSLLDNSQDFIKLVTNTAVSIDEWHKQNNIYKNHSVHSLTEVGFATFFLNRCNRSGILGQAGPIGGYNQSGKWKINVRYNKDDLVKRINKIIDYKERIEVHNLDGIKFLKETITPISKDENVFVFLDPPYYQKGPELYLNSFEHENHIDLSAYISNSQNYRWIMTYDCTPAILTMYQNLSVIEFSISYSANKPKFGKEYLIHNNEIMINKTILSELKMRTAS